MHEEKRGGFVVVLALMAEHVKNFGGGVAGALAPFAFRKKEVAND